MRCVRTNMADPCSWNNVLSLVGHLQSVLLMAKGTKAVSLQEALDRITNSAEYGADQSIVQRDISTSAALCM